MQSKRHNYQLSQLRDASNQNESHGLGEGAFDNFKHIPRDNLRLVNPLGRGAFGEVYEGMYKQLRAGTVVEVPVAVKTLQKYSTKEAEKDFSTEAAIMNKFNDPNIVHLIGVCFDKSPRFIIIELLAGGDLRTFLKDSQPTSDQPSALTIQDLLNCAKDVAKGCKYLEDNRFIHRDIAARNCLLTTRGPGRVVKIADFGMSRDIYRDDYYRKHGNAKLPIKWMPPEAFLKFIFSSKTDVWSFGVLLWEVMSLGDMPYSGCRNEDVIVLIPAGSRLKSPINCPPRIYAIMTACWRLEPDERPNFGTILERLESCMQDSDIIGSERYTTIMRPSKKKCNEPEYLIPSPRPSVHEDYIQSDNSASSPCSPSYEDSKKLDYLIMFSDSSSNEDYIETDNPTLSPRTPSKRKNITPDDAKRQPASQACKNYTQPNYLSMSPVSPSIEDNCQRNDAMTPSCSPFNASHVQLDDLSLSSGFSAYENCIRPDYLRMSPVPPSYEESIQLSSALPTSQVHQNYTQPNYLSMSPVRPSIEDNIQPNNMIPPSCSHSNASCIQPDDLSSGFLAYENCNQPDYQKMSPASPS